MIIFNSPSSFSTNEQLLEGEITDCSSKCDSNIPLQWAHFWDLKKDLKASKFITPKYLGGTHLFGELIYSLNLQAALRVRQFLPLELFVRNRYYLEGKL